MKPWPTAPRVGYVEIAGFSPDSQRLFVASEAMDDGQPVRRFAAVDRASLEVKVQAAAESAVAGFKRSSSPSWRASTLALR